MTRHDSSNPLYSRLMGRLTGRLQGRAVWLSLGVVIGAAAGSLVSASLNTHSEPPSTHSIAKTPSELPKRIELAPRSQAPTEPEASALQSIVVTPAQSEVTDSNNSADSLAEALDQTEIENAFLEIDSLHSRLALEQRAREQLQEQMVKLRSTVFSLEETVTALNQLRAKELERERRREFARRSPTKQSLFEAGIPANTAERVAQLYGEQQMALLRLRQQASQERWLNSDRYREAVAEINEGPESVRSNLSDDDYRRFLYSRGQDNAVYVSSIIQSSTAETLGLKPGDRVISYDGVPIYSNRDLTGTISSLDEGLDTTIEIDRDGRIVMYDLPSGPIGIGLDTRSEAF